MQLTTVLREHARTQCANAALVRLEHPLVNLIGLYDEEANARRRRCHEAALLRFVTPMETEPEVQYSKTHKRRSNDDDIVQRTLLELCGNDSWSPALCGYAHKLKRPKLQLCDDIVRNAMLGVY